ncbi:MAG: EscU/YscU/HrcU family type III secretion system export apparatus switch protein [Alphaproteobacteria bacterium]|nr:EscU/YscU/HrcU family type III secretion system export apparatus switch protein [Alphaproteobacteria bacterium]
MSDKDYTTSTNKNNDTSSFSTSSDENYAVALGYDEEKNAAPIVLAKGQGDIAEKIIEIARENNIEIRQDGDLLQVLKAVNINQEIPVEAFAAVAEIISYIYRQNAREIK